MLTNPVMALTEKFVFQIISGGNMLWVEVTLTLKNHQVFQCV